MSAREFLQVVAKARGAVRTLVKRSATFTKFIVYFFCNLLIKAWPA